jgi:hypothetical protein
VQGCPRRPSLQGKYQQTQGRSKYNSRPPLPHKPVAVPARRTSPRRPPYSPYTVTARAVDSPVSMPTFAVLNVHHVKPLWTHFDLRPEP